MERDHFEEQIDFLFIRILSWKKTLVKEELHHLV